MGLILIICGGLIILLPGILDPGYFVINGVTLIGLAFMFVGFFVGRNER